MAREKLEDITLKLMEIQGEFDENDLSPKIILGLLNQYLNSPDDMSNVIEKMDKLIDHLPDSCEWVEMEIHFLSDGYYLAEQNIYGDIIEVFSKLKKFLNQFIDILQLTGIFLKLKESLFLCDNRRSNPVIDEN